ncbi:TolC family protein [Histidinibacterium aquaticum]|uniref:TolC family protein n=1 Tax=Histidinibacterium aquaticum TaxID=2613962 RepID=UPI00168B91E7|nr:TolC family protein [Histidinibacterium aquaticum]
MAEAFGRMQGQELQLQILDLEREVAEEVVRQARAQRLPRVSLRFQTSYTQQDILSADNTTFSSGQSEFPTTSIALQVSQPLYDATAFRAMPVAQAEQAVVAAEAEQARQEIAGRLVGSYLSVAEAALDVRQAEVLVRARTQLERILELEVQAGRADRRLLDRATGDTFGARAELSDAQLGRSDALFDLYRFTGPEVTSVVVPASIGIPSISNFASTFSRDRLLQMSPRVEIARARAALARKRLEQIKGERLPSANLTLDVTRERTEGSLFGGGSDVQSSELGLSVDVPIYEGGVVRSRIREAETRVQIEDLRVREAADLVTRRYGALLEAAQQSQARTAAIGQQLNEARQELAGARAAGDAGRADARLLLEQGLRVDILAVELQASRLRTLRIQAELLTLFGALDVGALSQQLSS